MNRAAIIGLLFALLGIAVFTYFLVESRKPLREVELSEVSERFIDILPEDLPPEHVAEIAGLLRRFETKAQANQVRAEDYAEVMNTITGHLAKGSVSRDELNLVMAKVGYYQFRAESPDSTDIHPLLDPVDDAVEPVGDDTHDHDDD